MGRRSAINRIGRAGRGGRLGWSDGRGSWGYGGLTRRPQDHLRATIPVPGVVRGCFVGRRQCRSRLRRFRGPRLSRRPRLSRCIAAAPGCFGRARIARSALCVERAKHEGFGCDGTFARWQGGRRAVKRDHRCTVRFRTREQDMRYRRCCVIRVTCCRYCARGRCSMAGNRAGRGWAGRRNLGRGWPRTAGRGSFKGSGFAGRRWLVAETRRRRGVSVTRRFGIAKREVRCGASDRRLTLGGNPRDVLRRSSARWGLYCRCVAGGALAGLHCR